VALLLTGKTILDEKSFVQEMLVVVNSNNLATGRGIDSAAGVTLA
jgi:hypothetical protein